MSCIKISLLKVSWYVYAASPLFGGTVFWGDEILLCTQQCNRGISHGYNPRHSPTRFSHLKLCSRGSFQVERKNPLFTGAMQHLALVHPAHGRDLPGWFPTIPLHLAMLYPCIKHHVAIFYRHIQKLPGGGGLCFFYSTTIEMGCKMILSLCACIYIYIRLYIYPYKCFLQKHDFMGWFLLHLKDCFSITCFNGQVKTQTK